MDPNGGAQTGQRPIQDGDRGGPSVPHITVGVRTRADHGYGRAMSRVVLLAFAAVLLAACAGGGSESGDPTTTTPDTTTTPSTTTTTATPTTTTTPPLDGTLTVVGPEEIVFDWTTDRCEDIDIPDLPARAFRNDQGDVSLISTHPVNRRFFGPNLGEIERICDPIFESTFDPDPARFTDAEWIASLYTEDGVKVNGLVHNEYQGWER